MAIATRQELVDWLDARPSYWSEVIATRAALRVVPLLARSIEEDRRRLALLDAFRALSLAWGACSSPHLNLRDGARAAAESLAALDAFVIYGRRDDAADAVLRAVQSIGSSFHATLAADAVEASAHAFSIHAYPNFAARPWADDMEKAYAQDQADAAHARTWEEVSADCDRLASDVGRADNSVFLATRPLSMTSDGQPYMIGRAARHLPSHWGVWIDWHQRRVEGRHRGFYIPGDTDGVEDEAILKRLAEAGDEEFWAEGPEHVNAALSLWLKEAQARTEGRARPGGKLDLDSLAGILEKQASPEARVVDGKLDAGPNQCFDAPRYSDDLAALPSVLLANAGALRDSLPPNAGAVIGRCLDAYQDELRVRGNRPILSILKSMASAIRAEVFVPPVAALEEQPSEWVLRDTREWGAGTADLFRSFFQFHLDLITHFPLDPEREALFEATPIDEVAASGPALTEPVDAVAAMIRDLADKGFATENIVRIIEAHRLFTRDVAQLPPSPAGETVSPKRRHVLSSAGFYLSAYSVLGSTASIAPFAPAVMEALRSAAAAMFSFIR